MLPLWKKSYDKHSILKSRRHYFADKGPYSQRYVFSNSQVCMWELRKLSTEELILLNCGVERTQLRCWRRLLRVPWTAKRSNQSILKEISPEYSLEGLMLKLQYFDHLIQRVDSLEKILMLGKIEGNRRRGQQRMSWLNGITNSVDMSLSKL